MKLSSFFPLTLHVIVACTVIGDTVGLSHVPNTSPIALGAMTGLSVSLGITAFVRLLMSID